MVQSDVEVILALAASHSTTLLGKPCQCCYIFMFDRICCFSAGRCVPTHRFLLFYFYFVMRSILEALVVIV